MASKCSQEILNVFGQLLVTIFSMIKNKVDNNMPVIGEICNCVQCHNAFESNIIIIIVYLYISSVSPNSSGMLL